MKNPHRLKGSSAIGRCDPVGIALPLLKQVCRWGWASQLLKPGLVCPILFLPPVDQDVELSLSACYHVPHLDDYGLNHKPVLIKSCCSHGISLQKYNLKTQS